MLIATTGVVRAMGVILRRADAELAHGAALNAAVGVATRHARQLEDARTLRDLRSLAEPARVGEPEPTTVSPLTNP